MNKQDFLKELSRALSGLPREDLEERLAFYSEMIDDRAEETGSEEAAISEIGTVDNVVKQIMTEIPLTRIVKERVKPKQSLRAWEIILLVLGSPIWLSILIALFAVILSVYIVIWSVVISVWAVELALALSFFVCLIAVVFLFIRGEGIKALFALGAGLVCGGLAILFFYLSMAITRGMVKLTKTLALKIKTWFAGKEKNP